MTGRKNRNKPYRRSALPLILLLILTLSLTPVQAMDFSDGTGTVSSADIFSDSTTIDSGSSASAGEQSLPDSQSAEPGESASQPAQDQASSALGTGEEAEAEYEITLGSGEESQNLTDGQSTDLPADADGEVYYISGSANAVENPGTLINSSVEDQLPADLIEELHSIDSGLLQASSVSSDAYRLYCAADTLRSKTLNRITGISLSLSFEKKYSETALQNFFQLIENYAFKETDHSYEGDYLLWNILSYSWNANYSYPTAGGTKITYAITYVYSETKAQENYVTQMIPSVLSAIGLNDNDSSYVRIRKIYNYVCRNVSYDDYHLNQTVLAKNDLYYPRMYSPYAALHDKTCVCQGFATLLYRLLREAGVPVRCVASSNHIWNIVYLKGSYYNVDATWDCAYYVTGYQYFLKNMSDFSVGSDTSHTRESEYTTSTFNSSYPMAVASYTPTAEDYNSCSHQWGSYFTAAKASCTKNGYRCRECKICGMTETKTLACGHKFTSNCTYNAIGNTHKAYCSVCGLCNESVKCTYSNGICTVCGAPKAPAKVTGLKAAVYTSGRIRLTWKAVSGATGYAIYRYNASTKKWVRIGNSSSLSFIQKSSASNPISKGTVYYYRARAYVTKNGVTRYGAICASASVKAS